MRTIWIGFGGALGSMARHHVDLLCQRRFGTAFPYGTLAVNVIGSFLLAALLHVSTRTELVPAGARVALATGVLGGFTTYSTFNHDTFRYFQGGAFGLGALNVIVTVSACLAAAWLGWAIARVLAGG
jgi:CrcB protein